MSHIKNRSAIWMIAGIIAFVAIAYLVSPQWNSLFVRAKSNITSAYNAPQWWGCPMMKNFQATRAKAAPTDNTVTTEIAYETVNVWHNEYALVPETVTLTAGKSYKLIITPSADWGGCMSTLTIPGIDNNVYPIIKGQPITIVINNAQAGTYDVVCWAMGMYQWSLTIQ